jgi:hypothetical protein
MLEIVNEERSTTAAVVLPERIQAGTHACWIEGERLNAERPCP